MKLTKTQDTKLTTWFEEFWALLPVGNKKGHGDGRKAWLRLFKKVDENEWLQLYNDIKEGHIKQESHRKRLLKEFPDDRAQRVAGVFVPSRPHPATWLNGERWKDGVQDIEEKISKKHHPDRCVDCEEDGIVLVTASEGVISVCAWHWTKRYRRDHLEVLYEKLKEKGLGKLKDETKQEWSDRCRESLRGTKWGNELGA